MQPDEFKQAWELTGDRLLAFPAASLAGVTVPSDAREFLQRAGLPGQAAPFLIFHVPAVGPLPSATSVYPINGGFDAGTVIGSTGSGDPIVITTSGTVAYLDHDCGFASHYINRSIPMFAATLLRYRNLIQEACEATDGDLSETQKMRFIDFLKEHDPKSLNDGSMWIDEIKQLND